MNSAEILCAILTASMKSRQSGRDLAPNVCQRGCKSINDKSFDFAVKSGGKPIFKHAKFIARLLQAVQSALFKIK